MKNLIIIGSGGHARPAIEICKNQNLYNIRGVIDVNYDVHTNAGEKILEIKVLGGINKLTESKNSDSVVFIAIGNNQKRESMANYAISLGFSLINVIHESAIISKSAKLKDGVFIGPNSHVGQSVSIGRGVIINTNANVEHESVIGDFSHLAPGSITCGRTVIGEKCFIGANASIIDKISVANNTIIGSGAVITKDITLAGQTYVGIPGKSL